MLRETRSVGVCAGKGLRLGAPGRIRTCLQRDFRPGVAERKIDEYYCCTMVFVVDKNGHERTLKHSTVARMLHERRTGWRQVDAVSGP